MMAGRGRGKGRGLSFNVENLGFGRGEGLPGPILQPPPNFPVSVYLIFILVKLNFAMSLAFCLSPLWSSEALCCGVRDVGWSIMHFLATGDSTVGMVACLQIPNLVYQYTFDINIPENLVLKNI